MAKPWKQWLDHESSGSQKLAVNKWILGNMIILFIDLDN